MAKLRGNRSVSYTRVSTNSEEQKTSIEAQKQYYNDKFNSTGYAVANSCGCICSSKGKVTYTGNGIYADEGISGTSYKHRKAFNLMIEDAKAGKFDIIFVKSFSRYARSTIDGLKTCEELRDIGVGVFFEDYNICSINEDKDFELALFFSLAQKESQTKSYNVKWGLRQRQKSKKWRGTPPYGYVKDENGEFQLDPDERKIEALKLIVKMYLEGSGVQAIVTKLRADDYPTYGRGKWCCTAVRNILRQDLYNGHYYTHTMENSTIKDHSKKIYIPREEQIHIPLPHCKIFDDDIWQEVQDELKRRLDKAEEIGGGASRQSNTHLFSNLIYCECGCCYRRKANKQKKPNHKLSAYWKCTEQDKYHKGSVCVNAGKKMVVGEATMLELIKDEVTKLKNSSDRLLELFMIKELITIGFPMDEAELSQLRAKKAEIEGNIKKLLFRMDSVGGVYEDMLKDMETELKSINATLDAQKNREQVIKRDKVRFDNYLDFLKEVDVENLDNVTLKKIFYKVNVVDMANYGAEETKRGIIFDYMFLGMSYTELIDRALELKYPYPEKLYLDVIPFPDGTSFMRKRNTEKGMPEPHAKKK